MGRTIIVCEGQTEQEFCRTILYPYFQPKDIYIENPTIKKTGGGIVAWEIFKKEIENHLRGKEALVTTFIDYYGIKASHKFPNWEEVQQIPDKNSRIDALENAMHNDISDALRDRFIPYVQLHEFEALLFIDLNIFNTLFARENFADYEYLKKTIEDYPNPEMINDNKITAPSKRLEDKIMKSYSKIQNGNEIAKEIGLVNIRQKCPRFNNWIEILEKE